MHEIDLPAEWAALRAAATDLQARLDQPDDRLYASNPEVSGWSVAQQVYHAAKAGRGMLRATEVLTAPDHNYPEADGPNRAGQAVLLRGRFPRGRGEAPANTRTDASVTREELTRTVDKFVAQVARAEAALAARPTLRGRIDHPYFGPLNAAEWVRNARIHTDHHLAIIREIEEAMQA